MHCSVAMTTLSVCILYTGTNAGQQDKVNIFLSFHCNNVKLNNRQNALFPATMRKSYFKLSATYSSIICRERIVAFPWQWWLLERITLFFRWLGAFEKSRKAPISFVTSVRLSICINSALTGWSFREIWYWGLLLECVEKINVSLKSDMNIGYFTSYKDVLYCWQRHA
jgi:hypothetical protein